ncbi:MAG: hypothetical protein FWF81_09995, partial [Defluviitaleaceae bacterium]|nr:hypothetical protein [Defluviitaleaceae bacterium]
LIESLDLENRCTGLDKEFSFFLHQGSCSGENEQFYDVWITSEDVEKIPPKLHFMAIKIHTLPIRVYSNKRLFSSIFLLLPL